MARALASQLNKSSTTDLSTTVFLFLYDATFEKLARVWLIELIRAQVLTATWVVGNIISFIYRVGKGLCSVWERDIIYFISGLPLVGFFPCSVSHKLGICVA